MHKPFGDRQQHPDTMRSSRNTKVRNGDARPSLQPSKLERKFSAAACAAEGDAALAMRWEGKQGQAGGGGRQMEVRHGSTACQEAGVAAARSSGSGGSCDDCCGTRGMETLARRETATPMRRPQRQVGRTRTAEEGGAALAGGGAAVDDGSGANLIFCNESCVARAATCRDWAPRRWAPGQGHVMAQASTREPAEIEVGAPEGDWRADSAAGRRSGVRKGLQFVTLSADGRGAPRVATGGFKGGGRGGRGGGRGSGGAAGRAEQGAHRSAGHVGRRWAAVELQRAARGLLARQRLEELHLAKMRAQLARIRGGDGGSSAKVETLVAEKMRAAELEGELVQSLRRELGAEVRRRSAAERQLAEARRALVAAGERRGGGAVTRAVAATMTEPVEASMKLEVGCGGDGSLSATEASTQVNVPTAEASSQTWLALTPATTQTEEPQTEAAAAFSTSGGATEVVVGRQLHPAQAKAVERAEQAAARIEELSAQAETAAARYSSAPAAANQSLVMAARTGGRQVRKEQARRRAALAGMDTREWTRAEGERKRVDALMRARVQDEKQEWLAMGADEDGRDWRAHFEDYLQEGQREWLRRQALPRLPLKGAYVGEENAQRSFLQATQAAAISVREAAT